MKVKLFVLSSIMICFVSICLKAQDTANNKQRSNWTVGYQTGVSMFKPKLNRVYKSTNVHYLTGNSVYGSKFLSKNIALEVGINYDLINKGSIDLRQESHNMLHPEESNIYNISIPVAVQYYLLPANYKFRPYIGVGVEAGQTFYSNVKYINQPGQANLDMVETPSVSHGKVPYVGVAVTQGIVYQINTRLHVRENIHFQRDNVNGKRLGVNLGIGCRLGRR